MSFSDSLAAFVRAVVGPLAYLQRHPGKVVAQAADGTVEVQPDSAAMPPHKAVPLVLGLPGVKVKVGPGTRVRLTYASGNPEAPEVSLFEGDALIELHLDASVKVVVEAPQVLLGGPDVVQQVVLGTAYRSGEATLNAAWQAFLTALTTYATAIQPVADPGMPPGAATGPLLTAATAMTAALTTFEGGSAGYLSTTVKTK